MLSEGVPQMKATNLRIKSTSGRITRIVIFACVFDGCLKVYFPFFRCSCPPQKNAESSHSVNEP